MNIIRYTVFFILLTAGYLYGTQIVDTDPEGLSPLFKDIIFWTVYLISIPKVLLNKIMPDDLIGDFKEYAFLIIPVFWTLILRPLIRKDTSKSLNDNIDQGIVEDVGSIRFEPHGIKQKISDSLGLGVLTDVERVVLYRMSVILPQKHRHVMKEQLKKLNRIQRIKDEDGSMSVSSFERKKFLFFDDYVKPVFPIKDKHYELILASCIITSKEDDYISVDLIITKGVISKLQFQSDKDIYSIKGPFIVQDVRIHHLVS